MFLYAYICAIRDIKDKYTAVIDTEWELVRQSRNALQDVCNEHKDDYIRSLNTWQVNTLAMMQSMTTDTRYALMLYLEDSSSAASSNLPKTQCLQDNSALEDELRGELYQGSNYTYVIAQDFEREIQKLAQDVISQVWSFLVKSFSFLESSRDLRLLFHLIVAHT